MGSFLWNIRRRYYDWSIRHGHLTGVPLEYTCPRLRVAHHVPYWSDENFPDYEFFTLRGTSLNTQKHFEVLGQMSRSLSLVLLGLCEVAWRSPGNRPAPRRWG